MVDRAALTDQEIRGLYNYQNASVDETVTNAVTVDAEAPTSVLRLRTVYLANVPHLLQIRHRETRRPRSSTRNSGLTVGAGIKWIGAAADGTDATGNTWMPWFEPAGDGA